MQAPVRHWPMMYFTGGQVCIFSPVCFYIAWQWILKINSMVFLSVTASLLKPRKFFCPTKQFSKNLCAREQCPPCAHVTQMERRTDIYTIPKLNEEEDNREKNKGPEHATCDWEDPWIHSRSGIILLLAQRQNYDNLGRFMCTYKILLE